MSTPISATILVISAPSSGPFNPRCSSRQSSLAVTVVDCDHRTLSRSVIFTDIVILTINRFNPFPPLLRIAHDVRFDPASRWIRVYRWGFTDFQLKYAPRAWKQERLVWTTVVQLNLIKNVNNIVDVLSQEMAAQTTTDVDSIDDVEPALDVQFSEKHKILRLRLAPLRGVQSDLERKLGSGALEDHGHLNNNGRGRIQSSPTERSPIDGDDSQIQRVPREFYIRSNNSWKDRLKNGLKNAGRPYSGGVSGASGGNEREASLAGWGKASTDLEEVGGIIAGCKEDIKTLWEDEVVQTILSRRKYRVDESSGLCVSRLITWEPKTDVDPLVLFFPIKI